MTNKYMYFIANWKMYGGLNSLNSIHKVVKFFKTFKKNKFIKIIYCPPSTLIRPMSKKLKKTVIIGRATIEAIITELKNQILYFVINAFNFF